MPNLTVSKAQARRFLLQYHGLDGTDSFRGLDGILSYLRRVGCIQYDPLDVVGRNADLVLQARISGYSRDMLDKLLYMDRSLIDGWDKMASILLAEDWPFFRRIRERQGVEIAHLLRRRSSEGALDLKDVIFRAFHEKGPMLSTQMKMGEAGKGRWGHRNLSGAAMDYLFNTGEIGIQGKKGTQRIYDLIDNLLPEELLNFPEPFPDEHSFVRWYVARRIASVGLLWARNGGGWLGQHLSNKALRLSVLAELTDDGLLQRVFIDGITEPFHIRTEDVPMLNRITTEHEEKPVTRVLAPLDNLIWDRDMTRRIFGFEYTWEVYLPVDKRKYGYYVLPVLYGDRIVARFEPIPQRGNSPLTIRNWWWEKDITVNARLKDDMRSGLRRFAGYLGTEYDGGGFSW